MAGNDEQRQELRALVASIKVPGEDDPVAAPAIVPDDGLDATERWAVHLAKSPQEAASTLIRLRVAREELRGRQDAIELARSLYARRLQAAWRLLLVSFLLIAAGYGGLLVGVPAIFAEGVGMVGAVGFIACLIVLLGRGAVESAGKVFGQLIAHAKREPSRLGGKETGERDDEDDNDDS